MLTNSKCFNVLIFTYQSYHLPIYKIINKVKLLSTMKQYVPCVVWESNPFEYEKQWLTDNASASQISTM